MRLPMAEEALTKIRKFEIEDIDEILEIEEQAFPKTAYSKETILGYAKGFPDNFVVLERDREIVGYIIFDMSGHIHSTAVKHTHRGKGFGKMLFTHAMKCAKKRVWLEVRSRNSTAIRFYKRLGMEIVEKIPDYYGSDDALIMVLSKEEYAHN